MHSHNIQNRIKAALVNIQSLKHKSSDLVTYLNDAKLDLCILTETWLREEDDSWVSCSDLNITNYRLSISNRINRRGGSLALVHKTALPTKKLDEGQMQSFKFAVWSTKIPGSSMAIIAVYHPPYSTRCPVTNSTFIDDFTEWLPSQLVRCGLKWARKEFVSKSILECDRDNQKLYKLASSLMGATKENPLPECDSKEDLANQFAEFFIAKIQTIGDRLDNLPVYDHKDSSPPKLAKFEPLTEEEVRQIINAMPSKCCDLDVVPTSLLKEALELLLPTLMKLVNLSLAEGVFIQEWKIALVKPY